MYYRNQCACGVQPLIITVDYTTARQ